MVLCGKETRDYLINYARSLIYTTALGFPFLASIRTSYELLSFGETVSVIMLLDSTRCMSLLTTAATTTCATIDPPSPPAIRGTSCS